MKPIEDLELREAVAVEIMGVHVIHYNKHDDPSRPCTTVVIPHGVNQVDFCGTLAIHQLRKAIPAYESSIEAALAVVEKMREKGFWCEMRNQFTAKNDADCWAGFTPLGVTGWNGEPDNWTRASTIPLAICRAALQAVRAK